MGFFDKLKSGLTKTKSMLVGKIDNLFKSFRHVDEELFEQLEELLIEADIGVNTTEEILETVAAHVETGAFSTFKISSYPANFLNAGQCIFAIDSTGGATWMGSDAPLVDIPEENMVDFDTAVMTIPQFDENNPQMWLFECEKA